MLKYLFSASLTLTLFTCVAQFDSTDWGPKKWVPSEFRVGINVFRPTESVISDVRNSFEFMAELDFHKYFVVVEYGNEEIFRGETFEYSSEGSFFRIGIDQDLIPFNQNRNIISFGLRYARSTYKDIMTFTHTGINGQQVITLQNDALRAAWIEMTLGLRARVSKNILMGYQVRTKLFKTVFGEGNLETFDIPGFGRHKRNGREIRQNFVGFDYYLYWTIPFRQKYIPPKPQD